MKRHHDLFGLYVPGRTPLHRMGVGWKYALLLLLTVPALWAQQALVTIGLIAVTAIALLTIGARPRVALGLPASLWLVLLVLGAYQGFFVSWSGAIVVAGNVWLAVYASRLITLTTPGPVLLDALVAAVRPLRPLGVDPERFGLAAALMVRSVPYLLGRFADVRDAARARGLERNLFAQVTPVVVGAVAFAQATGEALAARGLGEGDEDACGP